MIHAAFHYLGCRLNEAENEQIARAFIDAGFHISSLDDEPDIIVLNTCGVTSEAMRKSRNLARRMAALRPSILVLMGCAVDLMAQGESPLSDDELLACAPNQRMTIVRILRDDRPRAAQIIMEKARQIFPLAYDSPQEALRSYRLRMRCFIKIQDGCNNRCAYCSVRLARGPERSLFSADIINEINRCHALGEKEFVLTGVQLGAYRENEKKLDGLVTDILEQTPISRLRLGSIEPWHMRPELWKLWKNQRLCPHFHIPVQSGCNAVLTAMKRRTALEPYLEKLDQIRSDIPNVRISTDIIVGFPGETDDMWQETLRFLERAQFDDVHLFRFSARPGTLAASYPNPVPPEVKRERMKTAQAHIQAIKKNLLSQNVGKMHQVLWETSAEKSENGKIQWFGYSENYLKFCRSFPENEDMRGALTSEIFTSADAEAALDD